MDGAKALLTHCGPLCVLMHLDVSVEVTMHGSLQIFKLIWQHEIHVDRAESDVILPGILFVQSGSMRRHFKAEESREKWIK